MDSPNATNAEKTLFKGILQDDVEQILQSLKEVSLDTKIDIEVIDNIANDDKDHNSYSNWSIPRVPKLLPLHLACSCGNAEVVRLLLEEGAPVDSLLEDEETALHFASLYGNVECARKLVAHGSEVNIQTRGDTPLMLATACFGTSGISMKQNYLDIAKILINAKCDVNIPDTQGLTPLHLAAGKEDPEMLNLLIKAGADVNVRANAAVHPSTPLIGAVSAELEDNVQSLLEAGCHVNEAVYPGVSALSTALGNNALGIVLDLLEAGASPTYRVDTMHIQTYMGNRQYVLVQLLLAYGLDVNWQHSYDRASLLLIATRNRSLPMVKLLLNLGGDPHLENCLGTTPLWATVKLNDHDLLTVLLRWHCDLDVSSLEYMPLTPLVPVQLAIQMEHFTVAKRLLHFGCQFKTRWLEVEPVRSKLRESTPYTFRNWLQQWLSNPLSLHHLCMLTIRQELGPGLPKKVKKLLLPGRLKKYIITGDL